MLPLMPTVVGTAAPLRAGQLKRLSPAVADSTKPARPAVCGAPRECGRGAEGSSKTSCQHLGLPLLTDGAVYRSDTLVSAVCVRPTSDPRCEGVEVSLTRSTQLTPSQTAAPTAARPRSQSSTCSRVVVVGRWHGACRHTQ
eukprot:355265-Chlamydomonas_euryale.AAC.18